MPLTQDRDTPMMATDLLALPVIGNAQIHAGSIVAVNADGLAVAGAIATDLTYVGRAEISVDTRGLTSGTKRIEVRRNRAFQWAQDGTIDQSHLFQIAYILDDHTVTVGDLSTTHSIAGRIVGVEARGVWIEATDVTQEHSTDAGE
jgi:hypothetical protein